MTRQAGSRLLLALAAVAVGFAAADTYVVVLALPDMMAGVGLSIDELQRAAPIVSGFLLGYVAMLPLVGRVADLRGRLPVLVWSLVVFALGSLVTLAAYDLPSMVAGRFLQGLGGGGLVPATLALVADLYPPERRGLPLGVVGAVQEVGSVLGPLYGALVLAFAPWQGIFAVNLAVGLVLAAALVATGRRDGHDRVRGPRDRLGWGVAGLGLVALVLVMMQPAALASRVTAGLVLVPLWGESRWASPLGLLAVACLVVVLARAVPAAREVAAATDVVAALLLALSLGGIVLAFATSQPEVEVLSPLGPWYLAASAVLAVLFWLRHRSSTNPLVPRGALRATPAWGALVVSLLVGAALIAALVDVPLFARVTVHPDSQLDAALVLVQLLVALPVGALLGGALLRRVPTGLVTAVGMALATVGFVVMSRWGLTSVAEAPATATLLVTGLGFGLALAPVNAALLATTEDAVHGVASALLVVARMVGMLVGISALTAVGLRRYYAETTDLPAPGDVCASGTQCAEYTLLLKEAGLAQLQTVFAGAAVCAAAAGVVALVTLRRAGTGTAR
ncbi:MAG TPA: MFS transporter [Nocardioides sp.]|nr:MFS transporter [Nocardioides sp.]